MPEPIWTPGDAKTINNFGPASAYDEVLYTTARPGNPSTKDGKVTTEEVNEWIDFIRSKGVSVILALLDEKEFDIYPEPGLLKMYESAGLTCYVTPLGEADAWSNIMKLISEAEKDGKKVVTHCTGGIGRCGRVAASWLVYRHDLSPKDATLAAVDQALKSGVKRLGDTKKLAEWIGQSKSTV